MVVQEIISSRVQATFDQGKVHDAHGHRRFHGMASSGLVSKRGGHRH